MYEARAIVFDMDGVLLDSGKIWERVISELFAECGVDLNAFEQDALGGGDNSQQWAAYFRNVLGFPMEEDDIVERVVQALLLAYEQDLPLLPGAVDAISRLAVRYPLGLASSSPRPVIAFVLERAGLERYFSTWVSSDEVPRGKPAPDVYLEACARLDTDPVVCVAVEDSGFGIRAAKAAGLKVVAIPHPVLPVEAEDLAVADEILGSIDLLTPETIAHMMNR